MYKQKKYENVQMCKHLNFIEKTQKLYIVFDMRFLSTQKYNIRVEKNLISLNMVK